MFRVASPDGRVAWFCEPDREACEAMATELFGDGPGVAVEAWDGMCPGTGEA